MNTDKIKNLSSSASICVHLRLKPSSLPPQLNGIGRDGYPPPTPKNLIYENNPCADKKIAFVGC
ncbi:MAG: hypothetical protein NTV46_00460 [Verrucomicrobia bacterium]|nr:hypothetical protein [Verrucomicrobiota bacterium]